LGLGNFPNKAPVLEILWNWATIETYYKKIGRFIYSFYEDSGMQR
jgi:hypothetical protein